MIKIDLAGVKKTRDNLRSMAKKIDRNTEETLRQVAEIGWNYAQNLAPEWTGALKDSIIVFPESKESWLIVSNQPAGDNIPIHVMFDTGVYPNPRRASSLFFMQQTADFLEEEFAQRLNLAISRALKK